VSWVVGWAYLLPGFAHAITPSTKVPKACTDLYYLAFPLGFVASFLVHWAINTAFPPPGLRVKDDVDCFGTFTPEEAMKLGVAPGDVVEGSEVVSGMDYGVEKGNGEAMVRKL
jgi:nucleobase:cation symporter-1, NCS1 family